jgi:mono/diheme cytochrome c family protein
MPRSVTALLLCLPCLLCASISLAQENGRQLFLDNCAECHQSDGQGLDNIYPALAGNETVLGSGADVALVLRIGRGEMPSFKDALNFAEMAAIINYVRNSWGNSGAEISAGEVEELF